MRSAGATHEPPTQSTFGKAEIIVCIGKADAAGRADLELRQRRCNRLEIICPACRFRRKEFEMGVSAFTKTHHFRCRSRAGQQGNRAILRRIEQFWRGTRRYHELRPGLFPRLSFGFDPAPSLLLVMAPSTSEATARMQSRALGVRRVISIAGSPPATSARARPTAFLTSLITTTGITGAAHIVVFKILSLLMGRICKKNPQTIKLNRLNFSKFLITQPAFPAPQMYQGRQCHQYSAL